MYNTALVHATMDKELGYAFFPLDPLKAPSGEELLQYVKANEVDKAIAALCEGTDPNSKEEETGNTALHVAVLVPSEVLVKLLIVFDANLTLKNKKGQTALDIARDMPGAIAAAIAKDIHDIIEAQKKLESDPPRPLRQQATAAASSTAVEICSLLSLDGGGIRGLVLVQVLLEMEKRRKKLYPSSSHSVPSAFNWITGNSTGGIAALAFAAAGDTVEQGRKLYFELKDKVLGGDPPIPNDRVDGVFQKVYGTAWMSDITKKKISVMTTLATESPPILHIMSNYGSARNGQDGPIDQLVWKAARATSSVPVFFHPQDNKYLDGGLIANNPTTDAIIDMFEDAKNEKPPKERKLKMVLSLGCGITKSQPESARDIDVEPTKVGDFLAHIIDKFSHKLGSDVQLGMLGLKNFTELKHLFEMLLAQITQPNGEVLERSRFVSEMLGAKYFRINPPIDNVSFLTTNDEKLINMLYQVVLYLLQHCHEEIDPVLDCIYGQ